jgi:hypothetical protein
VFKIGMMVCSTLRLTGGAERPVSHDQHDAAARAYKSSAAETQTKYFVNTLQCYRDNLVITTRDFRDAKKQSTH